MKKKARGKKLTNQKICDKCKSIIKKGEDYCKLAWIKHEGKKQIYSGVGHICSQCLKDITGGDY